jgi:hypothetical protein
VLSQQPAKWAEAEQLLLGHEVGWALQRDPDEDRIQEADVIRRDNRGPRPRNKVSPFDTKAKKSFRNAKAEKSACRVYQSRDRLFERKTLQKRGLHNIHLSSRNARKKHGAITSNILR